MTEIVAYNEFRCQMAQLKEQAKSLVFDYEDSKGNKEARSYVHKLRQSKAAVEKVRKAEKAESIAYGRNVDAQAKEITAELEYLIDIHAKPLAAIEQREKDRVSNITDMIEGFGTLAQESGTLAEMKSALIEIKSIEMSESNFDEFLPMALQAKGRAVTAIESSIEDEEKRLAEAAELERLRAEEAKRKQAAWEDAIRKEAKKRAEEAAAEKAKVEREAAERRELELRLQAERAEREKVEAAAAAEKAQEDAILADRAERKRIEEAERAAAEKKAANKRHMAKVNNAAVDAFEAEGIDNAKRIVTLIAQGKIANITVNY